MKRFSLLIFLTSALNLFGQQQSLGLFGGLNRSEFHFKNSGYFQDSYLPQNGTYLGAYYSRWFTHHLGLRTEFVYQTMGGCMSKRWVRQAGGNVGLANIQPMGQSVIFGRYDVQKCDTPVFLEMPLLFQVQFGRIIKLHLNFGPSVGYLIDWSYDYGKEDVYNNFNHVHLSTLAGLGTILSPNGNTNILIQIRYVSGLSQLRNIGELQFRNRAVAGILGIEYVID